jgi:hypothetical protein
VVLGVHAHSAQPNGWQELRSRHVNLVLRPHPLATALTAKPRPQQTRLESRLESVSAVLRAGHSVSCTQRGGTVQFAGAGVLVAALHRASGHRPRSITVTSLVLPSRCRETRSYSTSGRLAEQQCLCLVHRLKAGHGEPKRRKSVAQDVRAARSFSQAGAPAGGAPPPHSRN